MSAEPFDCRRGPQLFAPSGDGGVVGAGLLYYRGDPALALRVAGMLADGVGPLRETADRCSVREIDGVEVRGVAGVPDGRWGRVLVEVRYRPRAAA